MTLGLAELWFDRLSGNYINVAPRPTMIDRHPGRFELHVLSFQEAFDYLDKAIVVLREHAPQLKILLTVSPVPLALTHRWEDVMVANTYSKSVLRAATEAIVAKYDFVTYFPSYESVVLSDRSVAWLDDMVHVSPGLVALNVGRMVEAFVETADERPTAIENEMLAVEAAKSAIGRGPEFATAFFAQNATWSAECKEFAIHHAKHLLATNGPEAALEIISRYSSQNVTVAVLKSQALVAVGRAGEAMTVLTGHCTAQTKSPALWDALLSAAISIDDPDTVDAVVFRIRDATPFKVAPHAVKAARWHFAKSRRERARILAVTALLTEQLWARTAHELAELFIDLGDLHSAEAAFALADAPVGAEKARADTLRAILSQLSGIATAPERQRIR